MVNVEKKMKRFLDDLEEKAVRECEKLRKSQEKSHQANQVETRKHMEKVLQAQEKSHQANLLEIRKRMENIESSVRQFRRVLSRISEAGDDSDDTIEEEEEDSFIPPEIYPSEFVMDYVRSDPDFRPVPFAMHYLEARLGDHYRGNRQGQCWRQKENGKYVTCKFEKNLEQIEPEKSLQFQFKKCLRSPEDYCDKKEDPEFFAKHTKWWNLPKTVDNLKLDAAALKKFLYYKHKNLPSVRSK